MKRKRTYAPAPRHPITMAEYQALAQRTSSPGSDKADNGMLGLIGETGEIADLYKKWKYQSTPGTPLPRDRFMEELGDVLWYVAELASGKGWRMIDALKDDFESYDEAAWEMSRKGSDDMRRAITGMAARASEICTQFSDCDFDRAKCHMRCLMVAAAKLAMVCGFTLQDAAYANIEKLKKRYPDGFDAGISMRRYE